MSGALNSLLSCIDSLLCAIGGQRLFLESPPIKIISNNICRFAMLVDERIAAMNC